MIRTRVLLRPLLGLVAVLVASALISIGSASAATSYPRYGQSGSAVRAVQTSLIEAGALRPDLRTGYFGASTRAAIQAVQKRHRLTASGSLNAATTKAINADVAKGTGPRTWYHEETIGTSAEGRKISAFRAGQPGKPVVVITATMHGEEDFARYVVRGLMEGRPITGVDLWLVPNLNPDGLAKDRRWVAGDVDLNRNFPNRFVVRANSGPRASSAKETRVITAFLSRVKPRYLVSWHSPLFGVDSYRVKDKALMNRLSKNLRIPVKSLDCHGSCHGTMTGWYNENFSGAAITVEYGYTSRSLKQMKGADADALLAAVGGKRR